ncbi:MAG: PAS domain-containing sensor histidine kinase [Spirochaetes bacterium GWB1_48_6]|nr:MAG: PAS domain-containing sensor histidine kinase [Spirochaetes bacterium GWB1_48_6]
MSRFIQRALEKLPKLDSTQVQILLQELVDENDLYESILQSMTTGILVTDEHHRVLFHNKASERFISTIMDPTDKIIWSVLKDQDVANFLKLSLETNTTVPGKDFSLDAPGQNIRTISLAVTPLVKNGSIRGSLITSQDITERKNTQARLRRAENLAGLTTLAAGVAHEIKNPLGSMGIHIQLIQKSLKKPTEIPLDQINHYLEVINEEINRLNGIVVDFLFAVRPMDTNLLLGHLNPVVKDLMDFLAPELEQAGINLEMDLDPSLSPINLDERFLKQAILNIVKNSLQAMTGGGTLKICTRGKRDEVRLIIQDSGVGIPEENWDKIFEPYFTTKHFGSGLGLTLVFKIIKEHGADIQLTSQVGSGTTMTIIFPLPQGESALLAFKGDHE